MTTTTKGSSKPRKSVAVAATPRYARDGAAEVLPDIVAWLREDATREPDERRTRGIAPRTLLLAANLLDAVAHGKDPNALLDGRHTALSAAKAVEAVVNEADKIATKRDAEIERRAAKGLSNARRNSRPPGWTEAIEAAATILELEPRTIARHFDAELKSRGITREDYIFPGKYS